MGVIIGDKINLYCPIEGEYEKMHSMKILMKMSVNVGKLVLWQGAMCFDMGAYGSCLVISASCHQTRFICDLCVITLLEVHMQNLVLL